jgi:hypothetical protein
MENHIELRMFGLVPYNISPIQQGIQFGHAVQEYNNDIFELMGEYHRSEVSIEDKQAIWKFEQWRKEDKTFIILNGGTTNDTSGTMQDYKCQLEENGITYSTFFEPDLNDALTAIVFLVDERVFNKKKYPDVDDWIEQTHGGSFDHDSSHFQDLYKEWLKFIGGEKNRFLREFLKPLKLA